MFYGHIVRSVVPKEGAGTLGGCGGVTQVMNYVNFKDVFVLI